MQQIMMKFLKNIWKLQYIKEIFLTGSKGDKCKCNEILFQGKMSMAQACHENITGCFVMHIIFGQYINSNFHGVILLHSNTEKISTSCFCRAFFRRDLAHFIFELMSCAMSLNWYDVHFVCRMKKK